MLHATPLLYMDLVTDVGEITLLSLQDVKTVVHLYSYMLYSSNISKLCLLIVVEIILISETNCLARCKVCRRRR